MPSAEEKKISTEKLKGKGENDSSLRIRRNETENGMAKMELRFAIIRPADQLPQSDAELTWMVMSLLFARLIEVHQKKQITNGDNINIRNAHYQNRLKSLKLHYNKLMAAKGTSELPPKNR